MSETPAPDSRPSLEDIIAQLVKLLRDVEGLPLTEQQLAPTAERLQRAIIEKVIDHLAEEFADELVGEYEADQETANGTGPQQGADDPPPRQPGDTPPPQV